MAIWRIAIAWLEKVLFGPWFYLDKIRDRIYVPPWILLCGVVCLCAAMLILRIHLKKEERLLTTFWRTSSRIFFGGVWCGLLGTFANSLASVVNHSLMPVALADYRTWFLVGTIIDKEHVVAGPGSKLFWLCDYIPPHTSGLTDFFFPGSYISPGDCALAVYFTISWFCLLLVSPFITLRLCRAIWRLGSKIF